MPSDATQLLDRQTLIQASYLVTAALSYNASEMYARNLLNFLKPALDKGELAIDWNDEVFAQSCLTHGGEIKHEQTRKSIEA